jgi:hypothetical protein
LGDRGRHEPRAVLAEKRGQVAARGDDRDVHRPPISDALRSAAAITCLASERVRRT